MFYFNIRLKIDYVHSLQKMEVRISLFLLVKYWFMLNTWNKTIVMTNQNGYHSSLSWSLLLVSAFLQFSQKYYICCTKRDYFSFNMIKMLEQITKCEFMQTTLQLPCTLPVGQNFSINIDWFKCWKIQTHINILYTTQPNIHHPYSLTPMTIIRWMEKPNNYLFGM